MKNATLLVRTGYALAGIRTVWRREKSFRTQSYLGLIQLAVTAALQPGLVWTAIILLCIVLVLGLEMINAALEYLMDKVHPEIAEEIKFAKDAAAGAVLLASAFAAMIGLLMLISVLPPLIGWTG